MKTSALEGTSLLDYRTIKPIQGELKDLSTDNYNKLLASFTKHGFFVPIFIWKDGTEYWCLDGHGRLRVLNGESIEFENTGFEIPVHFIEALDVKDAKEKLLKISSQYQQITYEGLQNFIDQAELIEAEIYEAVHYDALPLLGQKSEDDTEEDEPPEVSQDPPLSVLGEIYQLGRHRVMCGNANDLDKLVQQDVDMIFTDPPYNVDYTGKTKEALKIENDSFKSNEEYYDFLIDIFGHMATKIKGGAAVYVAHPDNRGEWVRRAFREAGFYLSQCIIWNKNNMVMGRQDYHWKHEPIIYGWKEGASHKFYGPRNLTTVWDIDRPSRSEEHPTMKPIALIAKALDNSTKEGDYVLDPFGGSGSTLIACEQLDRTCYMTELDPKYVDVIRKRYAKYVNPEEWEQEWQNLTPQVV